MGGCPTNKTAPIKGVGSTRSKLRRIIRQLTYCVSKDKTLTNLKGGGGGLIDDGCDTRGSEVPKKNRSRLPIEELAEKRPALLEAPLAYLQVYLSDDRERNSQQSPMLYFALNQCSLTYRYICTKLQKLTLKAPMLRDSMANLIMLLQTMGRAYPETSEQIAGQLHKFIAILEDLDRQLAELSNLQPINWQSIIAIINSMVQEHIVNIDTRPFTEFIPSMDDFTESKLLGKGAFGAVYKAVLKSELDVAVKLVPQTKFHTGPTDGTLFMDKMIASMIPNHPCICRIYCAFVASYIVPGTSSNEQIMKSETCSKLENPMSVSVTVMEAIDGANLTELLKKNATLSFNLTQIIMQQCMMAIEHLHFSGFVHRDIKPANMMITFNGRLKLIDFDISRVCIGHFTNSFHVSYFCRTAIEFPGGEKAGTKAYMAPEVHQGKAFGRASDWWSVGIVHFRLAFGRLPFRNQQLVDQIINKRIEWDKFGRPGDTKQAVLKNYLTKLLVKEPRNRLGSQDYAHIFDHALFTDVNWQKLPEQEMRCEELDATFAERTSTINGKELLSMCPGSW